VTSVAPIMPPVLCYHRIGGPLELGVTRVARSVFERQMTALARAGWKTLTLAQFAERLRPGNSAFRIRHSAFLLTFDDGYASLAEQAYPILADLGFTGTTFLVTGHVGRLNTWDVQYTRYPLLHLDWSTIEHWQARGFDFASHSVSHARLTWLDDARLTGELGRSRQTLLRRLGPEAGRAIAYPFGARDARVERLAHAAGYELGFGGVRGSGSPLNLARAPVYVWDVGRMPFGLRTDALGTLGRVLAHAANRCAVGTSWMLRLHRERGAGSGERSPTVRRRAPLPAPRSRSTGDSPSLPPPPSRGIPYPRRSSRP
jgi:peptidoglycan/xylan/chitin deacetylase (PgdA/CDA1 family)